MKFFYYCWSTFGGVGKSPIIPGTMGSLASLLIWAPVVMAELPWHLRLGMVAFFFFSGVFSIAKSLEYYHSEDPQEVVIDEVAGQGLALVFCPYGIGYIALGFLLFRLFDGLKPWPVSWADKRIKGPWGIMLDDIFAGIYAFLVLGLIHFWLMN